MDGAVGVGINGTDRPGRTGEMASGNPELRWKHLKYRLR